MAETGKLMTLVQILAPLATATIINVLLGGMAWRATQIEKKASRAPWYLAAGIIAYGIGAAAFLYAYRKAEVAAPIELLAASMVGQALGALVIFGLLHAIFRRDRQPPAQRAFEIGGMALVLLAIVGTLMF